MKLNDATPKIEVNPETYEVHADGELLTCEPCNRITDGAALFFILVITFELKLKKIKIALKFEFKKIMLDKSLTQHGYMKIVSEFSLE